MPCPGNLEVDGPVARLAEALAGRMPGIEARVVRGEGEAGGGSLPLQELSGWVVELGIAGRAASELEHMARMAVPPVIGTIRAGRFRLDARTLAEAEIEEAAEALAQAWGPRSQAPA